MAKSDHRVVSINEQRVAKYRQRMREAGFVAVEVWVPEERKQEIQEIAREWREVQGVGSGRMKDFERFAHDGVKADLLRVANQFSEAQLGSSADGEITIRSNKGTVYVRRYRRGSFTWRAATVISRQEIVIQTNDESEVLAFVAKHIHQ